MYSEQHSPEDWRTHSTDCFPRVRIRYSSCPTRFRSYGNLESKGATIVWGDFSEGVGKLIPEGESFDYVFDNYAKDVDTCKDLADCAKAWYDTCFVVWGRCCFSTP